MPPKNTRFSSRSASLKVQASSTAANDEKIREELDDALLEAMESKGAGQTGDVNITKETLKHALETNLKIPGMSTSQEGRDAHEALVSAKTDTTHLDQGKKDPETDMEEVSESTEEESSDDEEETEGERYTVPEGLPGAGTNVLSLKASDIDLVRENIGLLKVKRVDDITKLGYRTIRMPFGDMVVSPYSQIMIRAAAIYYKEIKSVGYSEDAIRAIHYSSVPDSTRLEMIEDNTSRPVKDFLERERLRYFSFVLQGLLIEEKNRKVADIFSVISEDEMKSRLTVLESVYKDAYQVYSIVSAMVSRGVTAMMPVPPFLQSSSELCAYVDAVAIGKKIANDITFNVPSRAISHIPTGQESGLSKRESKRPITDGDEHVETLASKKMKMAGDFNLSSSQEPHLVRDTSTFEDFTSLISHFEKRIDELEKGHEKDVRELTKFKEAVNKKMAEMSEAIKSMVVTKSEAGLTNTITMNKVFKPLGSSSKTTAIKKENKNEKKEAEEEVDTNMGDDAKKLIRRLSVFKRGEEGELAQDVTTFVQEKGEDQYKVSSAMLLVTTYRNRLMAMIKRLETSG